VPERYIVLANNNYLLKDTLGAKEKSEPLLFQALKLGKTVIKLIENKEKGYAALVREPVDMTDDLEIADIKFNINEITESSISRVGYQETAEVTPNYIISGICVVNEQKTGKLALLNIPESPDYPANLEVYDPKEKKYYERSIPKKR
jgi:hypothetical protein